MRPQYVIQDLRAALSRDDMVRWKQQMRFGRTSGMEFGNPDFVQYAGSFGARGIRVDHPSDLLPALRDALAFNGLSVGRLRR